MTNLDLAWDETEGRSAKRKREEKENKAEQSPKFELSNEIICDKIYNLIQQVETSVQKLSKLMVENPNTKREMKEQISKLKSHTRSLATQEVKSVLSSLAKRTKEKEGETEEHGEPKKMVSRGTQTEESDIEFRVEEREEELLRAELGNGK